MNAEALSTPEERVNQLISRFAGPEVCVADLICDEHPPDSLAYRIIEQDLSWSDYSYADLTAASQQFSAALHELGVRPGDRVATLMGKSWPYVVTLMGIWRLGAVHVPLFTAFAPPAVHLRLSGSRAKVVICDASQEHKLHDTSGAAEPYTGIIVSNEASDAGALNFAQLLESEADPVEPAVVNGDAPIIHVYTSGTTGNPKGVVVPVKALASFQAYAEFGHGLQTDDLFWCAADPGWAYGLYCGLLASFTTGIPSVLLACGFDPELTARILATHKITNFAAAPTVYRALRSANLDIPRAELRLRCASSAGEPLTPEVNAWAEEALGVTVHDHYGQTEAGMLINNHHHPLLKAQIKTGSMGRSMPGWAGCVLHESRDEPIDYNEKGRIAFEVARSPLAWFDGYDNNPAKSAEKFAGDGRWFLTGDTGLIDEDGYFFFSARDDDVIIMAGYRIGPFEVESVIAGHPDVSETAVVAVPDEVRGEVIEAFVVLNEGKTVSDELAKDIQQWVKSKYAAHAYPRRVHFTDSLPKTPSGKVQRFELKKRLKESREG